MTDKEVEDIIKSNMNLQMNLAGIRQDFEEKLQRTWVGLTDSEIGTIAYNINPLDGIRQFSRAIEAKLKDKNGFHSTEKNT
jgi:hypothetical protein